MVDPHGEYNIALKKESNVYRINAGESKNELYIPFWALPFNELVRVFPGSVSESE